MTGGNDHILDRLEWRQAEDLLNSGLEEQIRQFNKYATAKGYPLEWTRQCATPNHGLTLATKQASEAELRYIEGTSQHRASRSQDFTVAREQLLRIFNPMLSSIRLTPEFRIIQCLAEEATFEEIDTSTIRLVNSEFVSCKFGKFSAGATLSISGCEFIGCLFEDIADLKSIEVKNTRFTNCIFNRVSFEEAHLPGAFFQSIPLAQIDHKSILTRPVSSDHRVHIPASCQLTTCSFHNADMREASFADVVTTSCNFKLALVDETTLFQISDRGSEFAGFQYRRVRTMPETVDYIALAIRAGHWRKRFGRYSLRPSRVIRDVMSRFFWLIFGYRLNIYRQMVVAIVSTVFFSILVCIASTNAAFNGIAPAWDYDDLQEALLSPARIIRCVYFVVVCMTTLGFGDINCAPANNYSHILVMLIVVTGYTLLSTLIARLITIINWPD